MRHAVDRTRWQSPVGPLEFRGEMGKITSLRFIPKPRLKEQGRKGSRDFPAQVRARLSRPLVMALSQMDEYFKRRRLSFELPLAPKGTSFQRNVWKKILDIPYGDTRSYRELAASAGCPQAVRACAWACARNPLPILVPCHRVIHANGVISGYAGGNWRKAWLLAHERNKSLSPQGCLLPDA